KHGLRKCVGADRPGAALVDTGRGGGGFSPSGGRGAAHRLPGAERPDLELYCAGNKGSGSWRMVLGARRAGRGALAGRQDRPLERALSQHACLPRVAEADEDGRKCCGRRKKIIMSKAGENDYIQVLINYSTLTLIIYTCL